MKVRYFGPIVALCMICEAQGTRAVRASATSTLTISGEKDEETIEITNASYQVTAAFLPGRPKEQRLVLRKTTRVKQIAGEMGSKATTTLEAWPMGADLKVKPLYSLSVSGEDGRVVDGVLFEVSRGLEDVEWWSLYQVGTGRHLFDTYVPLVSFSISREVLTRRYAGLEVPPDNVRDMRLKDPRVVGVLSYASAEKVIREVMITCEDPQRARLYRSYFDVARTMAVTENQRLQVTLRESYPGKNAALVFEIPITGDDLDVTHAKLPPGFRATIWKR